MEKEWRRHDDRPIVVVRRRSEDIEDSRNMIQKAVMSDDIDIASLKLALKKTMMVTLAREIDRYANGEKKIDMKLFEYFRKLLEMFEENEEADISDVLADPKKMFGGVVK